MVNEQNQRVKIVGARPFGDYVKGLEQVLSSQAQLPTNPQPALRKLLEKESLLFSREIEVMYDLQKDEVQTFIEKELSPNEYNFKEILGEMYIEVQ
ncbi:hypothetical protein ACWGJQ_17780 [Peribacillus simplex]